MYLRRRDMLRQASTSEVLLLGGFCRLYARRVPVAAPTAARCLLRSEPRPGTSIVWPSQAAVWRCKSQYLTSLGETPKPNRACPFCKLVERYRCDRRIQATLCRGGEASL